MRDLDGKERGKPGPILVLEAARLAAEEIVLDQQLIAVDLDACAAFLASLDTPAQSNDRLRETMRTSPLWNAA